VTRGGRRARPADAHQTAHVGLHGFGYFRRLGPGFVTGAADDDPAGIGTYSQIGAAFRYDLLWTALISLPLASAVQETAARLGLASGRGLMALIRARFARPVLWFAAALLVGANAFNIAADLGSMAEAFRLLIPLPFALLVISMAGVILLLAVFVNYERYSLILRWLALSIFAYVVELLVVSWSDVAAGLIPSFQPTLASVEALLMLILANAGARRYRSGWLSNALMVTALLVMTASAIAYLVGGGGGIGRLSRRRTVASARRPGRPRHPPTRTRGPAPAVRTRRRRTPAGSRSARRCARARPRG
jgi:Natural resistance-associated macrophage protein